MPTEQTPPSAASFLYLKTALTSRFGLVLDMDEVFDSNSATFFSLSQQSFMLGIWVVGAQE